MFSFNSYIPPEPPKTFGAGEQSIFFERAETIVGDQLNQSNFGLGPSPSTVNDSFSSSYNAGFPSTSGNNNYYKQPGPYNQGSNYISDASLSNGNSFLGYNAPLLFEEPLQKPVTLHAPDTFNHKGFTVLSFPLFLISQHLSPNPTSPPLFLKKSFRNRRILGVYFEQFGAIISRNKCRT